MDKNFTIIVVLVALLAVILVGWQTFQERVFDREGELVACTADAKMCPDGSYVGRSGPNCEFVCPGG